MIDADHTDERGAVLPLLALTISLIILVGAFTIDLGRAMVLRRDLQSTADVVALDASRFLGTGSTAAQLTPIRNAAVRSAQRNGWTLDPTDVHLVQRSGTAWIRIDTAATVPDGVEVVAHGSVSYNFQPGGTSTGRSAVAAKRPAAGVEIGTGLATVDASQSAMLNGVFGALGGNSGLDLSLVQWQGLAAANVTLGQLVAAAGSGDADTYLETQVAYSDQLLVVANALTANGQSAAAAIVNAYRNNLSTSVRGTTVRAGDLLRVSTVDPDSFADASLNVLSLLQGELLLLRNGSTVSGTFSAGVADIADVGLTVHVVQPPTIAFGPVGTSATNGQISVAITTDLAGLVPISLSIGAATGTATLTSVSCSGVGPSSSAGASVQTTLSDVTLRVLNLPVSVGLTAVPPTTKTFGSPFTWANAQHVGATSLGLAAAVGGATASGLGFLAQLVVNPLITPLENAVVSPILRALGVSVAGADVAVLDPVCLPPVLAR